MVKTHYKTGDCAPKWNISVAYTTKELSDAKKYYKVKKRVVKKRFLTFFNVFSQEARKSYTHILIFMI